MRRRPGAPAPGQERPRVRRAIRIRHARHSDDISETAVDTEFGDTDYLAALLMTSDNRPLAVGSSFNSQVGSIAVARYLLGQTPFGGTPVTLPGVIEVENYDLGGEGLAYHDLTPANEGGAYRPTEGVDVQAASAASNGNVLAFARASDQDFAIARYTPDGALDTTFADAGRLYTEFGRTNEFAARVHDPAR